MNFVACRSVYGKTVHVPRQRLIFRPSVYAAILVDGCALLVHAHSTGKFMFPGGGVEPGERLEEALRREVREETGLEVEVGRFAAFQEEFLYYDPGDVAYHCYLFYYHCRPLTEGVTSQYQLQGEEAERPEWVPLSKLRVEQIQSQAELYLSILGIKMQP